MIQTNPNSDLQWTQKAMAFVTRSHQHLWGKNNEDPQAFLFHQGLKNAFVKKMHLGWNKFGQRRPMENWGLGFKNQTEEKLFLAPGIVVPYITDKVLQSVFIHPYENNLENRSFMVPGSQTPTLVLGRENNQIILINDLFDGLFLFQETHEKVCVVIHPDARQEPDKKILSILTAARIPVLFLARPDASDSFQSMGKMLPDLGIPVKICTAKEQILSQLA